MSLHIYLGGHNLTTCYPYNISDNTFPWPGLQVMYFHEGRKKRMNTLHRITCLISIKVGRCCV